MKNINDNKVGTEEAIKRTGISAERLRYWEGMGIVRPEYVKCGTRKFRRYSEEDLIRAALVKKLIDRDRYTLEGAIRKLMETSDPFSVLKPDEDKNSGGGGYRPAPRFGSSEKSRYNEAG